MSEHDAKHLLHLFPLSLQHVFILLDEQCCITFIMYDAASSWKGTREALLGKPLLTVFPALAGSMFYQRYLAMQGNSIAFEGEEYIAAWGSFAGLVNLPVCFLWIRYS